jgi:urease accessory protein
MVWISVDHVLILLTVGVYFAQSTIKMNLKWLLPFPLFILIGGGLALLPLDLYGWVSTDEAKVLFGLALMAVLVKFVGVPKEFAMQSGFAVLHGYMHTYDMLLDSQAWNFSISNLTSTTLLVLCGMVARSISIRLAELLSWRLESRLNHPGVIGE